MLNKGKQLEYLTREIEKYLLPDTFEIVTNERIYNDEGIQIAEFDIQIKGKVGSTMFNWLIECRDRPAHGPAPGSWIEQLVGRRDRFNFDKVTAVSTTGFAEGAIDYAKSKGIDLRSVNEISIDTVAEWFSFSYFNLRKQVGNLIRAQLIIPENIEEQKAARLMTFIESSSGNDKILKSSKDGKLYTLSSGWQAILNQQSSFFNVIKPDENPKQVRVNVDYPHPDNRFQIEFEGKCFDITRILYVAELSVVETQIPISSIKDYSTLNSSESIAELVNFNFNVAGVDLNLDIYNIKELSQTFITMTSMGKTTEHQAPVDRE